MKTRPQFAALLLSLLVFCGCNPILDLEMPNESPLIFLGCSFSPDTSIIASVYSTLPSDTIATVFPALVQAQLTIQEDGQPWDTLDNLGDANYASRRGLRPQHGKTYQLKAEAEGYQQVIATDRVPLPCPILSATWEDSVAYNSQGKMAGKLSIGFQDDPAEANFYLLQITESAPGRDWLPFENPSNEIETSPSNKLGWIMDQYFNGQEKTLEVWIASEDVTNNQMDVSLTSCSEHYYEYASATYQYYDGRASIFSQPRIYHSNTNTRFGIFAAYSMDTYLVR